MFEFISKKFADIKILHEGYTADYFLNKMKTNALFPTLFIQNNLLKKKSGSDIFFRLLHSVHFREILSGYFLFSRFDWSIFVTQLVAKHMKEIISYKYLPLIISATGIVPQSLFQNLKIFFLEIQKGILLYSCHIVRKFLNIDTEHKTQKSQNVEARRR
jgi:hypothetical protein